jgi:hypothetical protein
MVPLCAVVAVTSALVGVATPVISGTGICNPTTTAPCRRQHPEVGSVAGALVHEVLVQDPVPQVGYSVTQCGKDRQCDQRSGQSH